MLRSGGRRLVMAAAGTNPSRAALTHKPAWQQSMLRINNPRKSLDFYTEKMGMTLLDKYDFPQWNFSLFFLATLKQGESYSLEPGSKEAHKYLWETDKVTLELTHNHGTEEDGSFEGYHPGNKPGDGFGHIAFATDDVYKASDDLVAKGVEFKKLPNEGRMKGLAFAYDPDGYWVELVKRESSDPKPGFSLCQTMLRIKDPSLSLPFYTGLFGMELVAERHYPPEKGDFSLYFLANKADVSTGNLPPLATPEAMDFIKKELYTQSVPVLELTHNHGTEKQDDFSYSNGNVEPSKGFGHIGYLVDDVSDFCSQLESAGVPFKKKPDEGNMKNLAFALDPDGYWIEIIQRGQAGDF